MSRTNKIIKNAKVSTFFFVLVTTVSFFSRSFFLKRLGDEYMGLTATLQSFLSFINLVELGVGSAMGFAMYKSLFNKNYERINELLALIAYLYNKIGKIVFIAGIILSLFFPFIFSKTPINILAVYYTFFIYLFSSLIYYFYNYHLMVLRSDQKGYVFTTYQQSLHILKVIIQVGVLYISANFILFITIELLSVIAFNLLIHKRIKKEYQWINFSAKGNKDLVKKNKDLITKIKQLFVHKIGTFVLSSTDNIVIYAVSNLQSVAYIGNYYLLIGSCTTLLSNLLSGTSAAVGNLVAENNKQNIKKVFWELMNLNHFIGGLLVMALYHGLNPVISIWLGEKYIMSQNIVILLLANAYIMKMRIPMDEFKNAFGLFQDTWAPIVETILNLGTSIILAYYLGISGVLIGTFVSVSLIALIWKPYFLYKNGFKESVFIYWKGFLTLLFTFTVSFYIIHLIINNFIQINYGTWLNLIWSLSKIGVIIITVYSLMMVSLNKGFQSLFTRFFGFIKNKLKK